MCFEDNFVQIGAPQIQISLNYLNIEILEHERIILGTQKENILPRLPKRFYLVLRLSLWQLFSTLFQLGGSLYLSITGEGGGAGLEDRNYNMWPGYRLSQSLPGLNGTIPTQHQYQYHQPLDPRVSSQSSKEWISRDISSYCTFDHPRLQMKQNISKLTPYIFHPHSMRLEPL